jgi:glycosyltransferase involved in cell wall biosynthesis
MKQKIIRITTVPMSLAGLLKGQLKFMSQYYEVIGISSSGDGFIKDLARWENIKTIPVEMTRKITPFKDLVAVYRLYRIFKKEQPLIVHSHTPKAGTLGMLASRLAGVPHRLHTIAGLPLVEAKGAKRFILNTVERITYACATKIYPNSFGLQDIILENKFTKKSKLKILGNGSSNGIDTAHYNASHFNEVYNTTLKNKLMIGPKDFVFVFVGRLVTDKGINELIKAFVKINKKYNYTKLLLVGPYETNIDPLSEKSLKQINNNKSIISVGWVDDVRPYFSISNCLVFPSYREGFPNVVLQAGSMKLPCIVTNINGCNEIISEPENGFIIPVKNSGALYNAMEKIYEMPKSEHKAMGERSRQNIISKFEQQFVWDCLLKEYKKIENKKIK